MVITVPVVPYMALALLLEVITHDDIDTDPCGNSVPEYQDRIVNKNIPLTYKVLQVIIGTDSLDVPVSLTDASGGLIEVLR